VDTIIPQFPADTPCHDRWGNAQLAGKLSQGFAASGFSDTANLDEGAMWPTSFALKRLTAAVETEIEALVKKAVSGD
jgi:hypothetical protein